MDKATSAKSDMEIFKSVCWEIGVRADDLEANKNLELSPHQQQSRVKANPKAMLAVIAVCALLIVPALLVRSAITYALAIFAVIVGLIMGYSYLTFGRASD